MPFHEVFTAFLLSLITEDFEIMRVPDNGDSVYGKLSHESEPFLPPSNNLDWSFMFSGALHAITNAVDMNDLDIDAMYIEKRNKLIQIFINFRSNDPTGLSLKATLIADANAREAKFSEEAVERFYAIIVNQGSYEYNKEYFLYCLRVSSRIVTVKTNQIGIHFKMRRIKADEKSVAPQAPEIAELSSRGYGGAIREFTSSGSTSNRTLERLLPQLWRRDIKNVCQTVNEIMAYLTFEYLSIFRLLPYAAEYFNSFVFGALSVNVARGRNLRLYPSIIANKWVQTTIVPMEEKTLMPRLAPILLNAETLRPNDNKTKEDLLTLYHLCTKSSEYLNATVEFHESPHGAVTLRYTTTYSTIREMDFYHSRNIFHFLFKIILTDRLNDRSKNEYEIEQLIRWYSKVISGYQFIAQFLAGQFLAAGSNFPIGELEKYVSNYKVNHSISFLCLIKGHERALLVDVTHKDKKYIHQTLGPMRFRKMRKIGISEYFHVIIGDNGFVKIHQLNSIHLQNRDSIKSQLPGDKMFRKSELLDSTLFLQFMQQFPENVTSTENNLSLNLLFNEFVHSLSGTFSSKQRYEAFLAGFLSLNGHLFKPYSNSDMIGLMTPTDTPIIISADWVVAFGNFTPNLNIVNHDQMLRINFPDMSEEIHNDYRNNVVFLSMITVTELDEASKYTHHFITLRSSTSGIVSNLYDQADEVQQPEFSGLE